MTTELTDTPKGRTQWRCVKFGDVVKDVNESQKKPLDAGFERYVAIEHIKPENLRVTDWGSLREDDVSFTKVFRKGQLLFVKRRAYQRKVAVAEFDGICSSDILTLEPRNRELIPELLPFIVQSDAFFEHALDTSSGSLSPRTRWSQLRNFEFILPDPVAQRDIADTLRTVNELLESWNLVRFEIENTIRRIRESEFSYRQKDHVPLGDLCDRKGIQIGPFGSQLHVSDYVHDGVPVVMPVNMIGDRIDASEIAMVSEKKADALKKHKLKAHDVLLARRGDLSKRAYVQASQVGWLCGTGSIRVRVKKGIDSRAVFHAIAAPSTVQWIERFAVGTTMPNTNADIVSKIPIHLPDADVCGGLVRSLDELDQQWTHVCEHIEKTKTLRAALFDKLLSNADKDV